MTRSFTPCTCDHCMLCPVAKNIAHLSDAAANDDANRNITSSMTTSETSLPAENLSSVEEALHNLEIIRNNNTELHDDDDNIMSVVSSQPSADLLLHHNDEYLSNNSVRNERYSDSSENDGDRWEAIEKLLTENANNTTRWTGTSERGSSKFASTRSSRRRNSVRKLNLEGEKQPDYEPHHSFFVTQALRARPSWSQQVIVYLMFIYLYLFLVFARRFSKTIMGLQ